jgi:hypothetical protein
MGHWQLRARPFFLSKCNRGEKQTNCRYAPPEAPDEWSLDEELLRLIHPRLENCPKNNKSLFAFSTNVVTFKLGNVAKLAENSVSLVLNQGLCA